MKNIISALFWSTALTVLLMLAGHAWAGTLLGVLAAAWVITAIAALFSLID